MERTWRIDAGGATATVVARATLARGTTVWVDGAVVVDDASAAIDRRYRLPQVAGQDVALSVRGAWPLPTRAVLTVGGDTVPASTSAADAPTGERPLPWWGRLCSATALVAVPFGSVLLLPLALLASFTALRVARGAAPLPARIAGAATCAIAAWGVAGGWTLAMVATELPAMLRAGGWLLLPLVLVGAAGVAFALLHLAQAHALSGLRATILLAMVVGAGWGMTVVERRRVDEAMSMASPAFAETLRAAGYREASLGHRFGLALGALMAVPAAVGEVRRARRGGRERA